MISTKKSLVELSGMGGWLAFLVFRNMLLTPLFTLGRVSGDLATMAAAYPDLLHLEQWSRFKSGMWLMAVGTSLVYFVAGYRLWKGSNWDAVDFAVKAEWIGAIGGMLGAAWVIKYAFGVSVFSDPSFWGTSAFGIISAAIWTAYLFKSERVRNTYR